jgi:succinate dehydrogenase / fumarate reductase flavoprotein subunit
MTRAATVVRENNQLKDAYDKVLELQERSKRCALSDTGNWSNQNVIFTKSVQDMIPVGLTILKGALQRDECRGAHYKEAFAQNSLTSEDPIERRRQAEVWCDDFEANNKRFLKSSVATFDGTEPDIQYEDVDTSLIAPRPRLYGLVGAEVIEEVWKERTASKGMAQEKTASKEKQLATV